MDRHPGVVEETTGRNHHLGVLRTHPVVGHDRKLEALAVQDAKQAQGDVDHDLDVDPRMVRHPEPIGVHLDGVPQGLELRIAVGGFQQGLEPAIAARRRLDPDRVDRFPSLQRDVGTLSQEAGARTKAGDVFKEGDVVRPKIGNVKLLSQPSDTGEAVATLGKGEELIFMGKEQDGFLSVETTRGAGWVKRILVTR